MSVGATVIPYSIDPASNRLLSVGGATSWNYSHDANGSVLSDGTRQYSYGARGRLSGIVTAQGTTSFDIDARNLRVRKSGPLGERYFHYDPAGRLIAESTASGSHDREYLYLDDLPVAVVADGTLYHIDADHLGTPRLVTNGQGNPVWRWEAGEPFGAQAPEEDPGQTGSRFVLNLRFPGQYYDRETQLHYNYFRDYDPATGRYVESDPIGLAGGINTYGYVGGNPLSYIDPLGLEKTADDMLGPDYKDSPPPPGYPTTDRRPVPPPPPSPPPPATPNPDPWPGPDDWRGQCIRLYTQCVNQGWTGSCGSCLNKCTAQHEWPFTGPGSCRPPRNQCQAF